MLVAFEFVVVREETAIKADRRNTRPGRFASKLQSVVFFVLYTFSTPLFRNKTHIIPKKEKVIRHGTANFFPSVTLEKEIPTSIRL